MAITLLEPPSPYVLPLLFFVVLFEVLLILGKRQRCKPLALNIKALTLRKYELAVAMKGVSGGWSSGRRVDIVTIEIVPADSSLLTSHLYQPAFLHSQSLFSVLRVGHNSSLVLLCPSHVLTSPSSTLPLLQFGIQDFVKKSKLERELIQVDKDLFPRKERVLAQATAYEALATKVRYGMYALLVVIFWRTPLLVMAPAATWPLSSFFGFPRLGAGAVGVAATISMVKAVLKPLTPLLSSV